MRDEIRINTKGFMREGVKLDVLETIVETVLTKLGLAHDDPEVIDDRLVYRNITEEKVEQ